MPRKIALKLCWFFRFDVARRGSFGFAVAANIACRGAYQIQLLVVLTEVGQCIAKLQSIKRSLARGLLHECLLIELEEGKREFLEVPLFVGYTEVKQLLLVHWITNKENIGWINCYLY
jgi:hypothetical protein